MEFKGVLWFLLLYKIFKSILLDLCIMGVQSRLLIVFFVLFCLMFWNSGLWSTRPGQPSFIIKKKTKQLTHVQTTILWRIINSIFAVKISIETMFLLFWAGTGSTGWPGFRTLVFVVWCWKICSSKLHHKHLSLYFL